MWEGGGRDRDGTLHAFLLIHSSIFFGYLCHWFKESCYRRSWIFMNSTLPNSIQANTRHITFAARIEWTKINTHEFHNRRYSVADSWNGCSCNARSPAHDREANRSWRQQQRQQKEDHKCFKIDSKGEFSHMNEPARWFTTSSTNQTQFFFFLTMGSIRDKEKGSKIGEAKEKKMMLKSLWTEVRGGNLFSVLFLIYISKKCVRIPNCGLCFCIRPLNRLEKQSVATQTKRNRHLIETSTFRLFLVN